MRVTAHYSAEAVGRLLTADNLGFLVRVNRHERNFVCDGGEW